MAPARVSSPAAVGAGETALRPPMPPAPATPRVSDIMTTALVTTSADTSLPDLVDTMLEHDVSGLPVVDDDGRLVGIVTEADVISKPAYAGIRRRAVAIVPDLLRGQRRRWFAKAKGTTAKDIMSTGVTTVAPLESVQAAARRMVEAGVKRLPVVDRGRLVGIVSRADVLRKMHVRDEDLQREIAAVLADPLRVPEYTLVEVTVVDGVVTMRGTVRYPIDLPVLSGIVWRFPGVVDVRNEVTAREPNPQPPVPTENYEYLRFRR